MMFTLGDIHATPEALRILGPRGVADLIVRHSSGDWGVVPIADKLANWRALGRGERVVSAYEAKNERFYVITEADRSATVVMLCDEY